MPWAVELVEWTAFTRTGSQPAGTGNVAESDVHSGVTVKFPAVVTKMPLLGVSKVAEVLGVCVAQT